MIRPIAIRLDSASLRCVLATVLLFASHLAADDREKDPAQEAQRQRHLENMQRSAAQYTLASADMPERPFQFHETPLMRPSNPITGTKEGALYVWTDRGRPQALLRFFTFDNKTYSHFWLSLSENSFVAERGGKVVWSPTGPGIELREIQGAPNPAETATARLRQMRTLSAKFSASYTATHLRARPFELRLLTQPLFRYETDDGDRADGALFGYAQSTTPIGVLLLESRQTEGGRRWHYAYSSLVTGPVTARYEDKEVFSLERNAPGKDPTRPYALFNSLPVPKE